MAATVQILTVIVVIIVSVNSETIDHIIEAASNISVGPDHHEQDSDFVIMELDMAYRREDWQKLRNGMHYRNKRQAVRHENRKWTNKVLAYEILHFNRTEKQAIRDAIAEWRNYTCVAFSRVTRNPEKVPVQANYVSFNGNLPGCYSEVGMVGTSKQTIALAQQCRTKRVILHEIGHALGLFHQHTRPDRDQHITVNMSNVLENRRNQMEIISGDESHTHGIPYDHLSIMHYSSKYFSSNGHPTIITTDPDYQDLIGNSPGLSFSDIKLVNFLYNCNETCESRDCPDEGFLSKNCECWCRGNTTAGTPVVRCPGTPAMDIPDGSGDLVDEFLDNERLFQAFPDGQ